MQVREAVKKLVCEQDVLLYWYFGCAQTAMLSELIGKSGISAVEVVLLTERPLANVCSVLDADGLWLLLMLSGMPIGLPWGG